MNTENNIPNVAYIDATGLTCPVPLMLLKKAMDKLPAGAQVSVDVTDVHAELDFEIWCERFGHRLEKLPSGEAVMCFVVVKGQPT